MAFILKAGQRLEAGHGPCWVLRIRCRCESATPPGGEKTRARLQPEHAARQVLGQAAHHHCCEFVMRVRAPPRSTAPLDARV